MHRRYSCSTVESGHRRYSALGSLFYVEARKSLTVAPRNFLYVYGSQCTRLAGKGWRDLPVSSHEPLAAAADFELQPSVSTQLSLLKLSVHVTPPARLRAARCCSCCCRCRPLSGLTVTWWHRHCQWHWRFAAPQHVRRWSKLPAETLASGSGSETGCTTPGRCCCCCWRCRCVQPVRLHVRRRRRLSCGWGFVVQPYCPSPGGRWVPAAI